MTTAHFQPLTWVCWWRLTGWMVGILRVYHPGQKYPDLNYKFMTVGVISGFDYVYIYGLDENVNIKTRDRRALDRCLYALGVRLAEWTHNNESHRYVLRGN